MEPSEAAALAAVAARVQRRFPDRSAAEIQELMVAAERAYDGRPIRKFVPILVERDVTEALAATPAPSRVAG